MPQKHAKLIIAASESDSNLYYACKFLVPDPIIYFEVNGKKYLVLSDLEIDRAKEEAKVDHLISLSDVIKKIKDKPKDIPQYALVVHTIFKEKKIKNIIVPANFGAQYYTAFKKLGYSIIVKPDPFYEKRLIKTVEEKNHIRHAILQVEKSLKEALLILEKSKIKKEKIYYGKQLVTSEFLQNFINTKLMERGCLASHTIIASGVQGSLPHHSGSGPIIPHTPIIFDIFPKDSKTRYWADMTRTFVKGKPSNQIKKMYRAVKEANEAASSHVRAGIHSSKIHEIASECLKKYGFKTGKLNGKMQGFIHGTGHGLGLDIHELPSVSQRGSVLKKGNVITIEPGLYYEKVGGIRLEDDLFVTQTGSEQLTKFPKFLEIDRGI